MDESIRRMVRRTAAACGGRTAIERGDATLTYGELERAAGALTDRLLHRGLARGSVVGILTADAGRLVTAILAVLEAGGIFMPLDPRVPAKRLASMVEETSPRWFLADRDLAVAVAEIAPGGAAEVLLLDALEDEATGLPAAARPVLGGDDPCYIYFTSGSTGRPKGVTGRLKGIDHFIRWEIDTFDLAHGPRVSQLTAPSFDAFLRDMFVPLCSGGTLCVPPDRSILDDAGKLVDWLDSARVELIHCVPSLFRTLLSEPLTAERLPALRHVLMAGEVLLPADVQRLTSIFGERIELVNLYGASEATMAKFFHRVRPEDAQRRTIPVGKPMPGSRGLILDARGRPRPVGSIGEIAIRTPYRSLGYYNRPEETSRVFVRNPLSDDPEDLLYRTGDLGRILEDGSFEWMGRKDQQVKIRGVRVELEEIEGLLMRHEAVREAAVVELPDPAGTLYLTGFVVLRPGYDVAPLRSYLAEHLPEAMVPSRFLAIEALPRSINGKIDRRELKALAEVRSGSTGEYAAPRNELEEMVAGLFSQLLGVEQVGIHDNFFQLGGHSLLAMQVLAQVRHSLSLEVPLRNLFLSPSVAGLAQEIAALLRGSSGVSELPPLVPVVRGADLPLSFAQQRLWFLDELEPGSPAYNLSLGLRMSGRLDVGALRETFAEIVRRHESLRTVFVATGGVPRQIVQPSGTADLPLIDLSALPPALRELRLRSEATAAFVRPFDLQRGPLVRAQLLKLATDEHAAVFCMHHIISDAWSMGILAREVTVLYDALTQGRASPLPPLPVQYGDFAQWQRTWLQGEALARQVRYWTSRLAGAAPLELPADRPQSSRRRSGREIEGFSLAPELTAKLKKLANDGGATLFMVLLTALVTLLHRITGQGDLSVGIPIANRTRVELEGLIGFFVNTLVLRAEIGGEATTFDGLLRQVREAAIEAQVHQDLPFEKLIEELEPERSLDQTPLFRVLFDLAVEQGAGLSLPGLRIEPLTVEAGEAKLDLLLHLRESGGLLTGHFEYRSALFERATIQRLASSFALLLEAAAAEPGRRLAEMRMLTGAELHQVLVERNERRFDVPSAELFPELFTARARSCPEAVALLTDEGIVTYGELADRAGRLARALRGLGVGPGALAAVCMDRSPYIIEAFLGVLQAGGAYVPLEPDSPRERIELVLKDSGARLLITRQSLLSRLPDLVPVLCLDRERRGEPGDGEPGLIPSPASPASPDDPAYVMYTSGSTGRPKGVVVPHRALSWYTRMAIDQYALQPSDRVLQVSSIAFDVSVEEIFPCLARGATLCLCADPLLRSPAFFLERCRQWGVTALCPPTAFWHALVDELAGGREEVPASLRLIVIGGETVSPARVDRWLDGLAPGVELINSYGPTETTVSATSRKVGGPAPAAALSSAPIGRPIPGAEVFVLAAGEPVPAGVIGELFLGGAGCSLGYLGRPDLTAERFVPHPFSGMPGERLYRTGDLARSLPDGGLDFVGRTDHQVKVRGFRVEPGEIDAALGTHPQVRESVTVIWEPTPGERRLVTYFVARPGEAPRAAGLRSFLQGRLPAYMVPAVLEPLPRLPLTPNGKVDRSALPRPAGMAGMTGTGGPDRERAPLTPVEEVIAAIWADVLQYGGEIGRRDDFFSLGGHSLVATRVISRIREAFRHDLPLRLLFESPTLEALAAAVDEARRGALSEAPSLARARRDRPLPLSFAQERLWFLDRLEPGVALYNIPVSLRVAGPLDISLLERTLAEIVLRHEALRTTFGELPGGPVQLVSPQAAVALDLIDLSALPEPQRGREAAGLAVLEQLRPFDLACGPLLRTQLIRMGPEEHLVFFTMHHIVSDGWSMELLTGEVTALYEAFRAGQPSPLPALPIQYADYAVWQRQWLTGDTLKAQLAYWERQLRDLPLLELPADRPRPARWSPRGGTEVFTVPAGLSRDLLALAHRQNATLFMTLLTGFLALLGRLTGLRDIPVGAPIAGRNRLETEGLIGFFVNTLVLRGDLAGEPVFEELLRRVRGVVLEAHDHQDLPFERLVERLQPERDPGRTPLFQTVFTVENAPPAALEIPDLRIERYGSAAEVAKFDLSLGFQRTGGDLTGVLLYSRALFDAPTIRRMAGQITVLLAAAVEGGRPLAELPLLSAAESQQAAVEWNDTRSGFPREASLPALFAAVVATAPQALAVVGEDGSVASYRRLDEESGRLARHLVDLGVEPGARVGVAMERSADLIVALLAILKTGAAYVPLDPGHPDERLAFLLEDTGAEVTLVNGRTRERMEALAGVRLICLDRDRDSLAVHTAATGALPPAVPAESLAYVIHTSGSTGRPKGVAVSHRAIVSLVKGTADLVLRPEDRLAWNSNTSFDAATFEIWATLLHGATLVVVPRDTLLAPALLAELLQRHGVTVLQLTTALFAQLAQEAPAALAVPGRVLFGGEASAPAMVARALAAGRPQRLLHMYGPTESTTFATWHPVAAVAPEAVTVPIGRPLADTTLAVVDRWRQLAAVGQQGELLIGGDGLAWGYWNRPELTAERFVPDPWSAEPGSRLYRTGDLVRRRPDGVLEFQGRLDNQVKIRGFRIEPGEIEAVLAGHPAVRECAVVAREDTPGGLLLAAYVTGAGGAGRAMDAGSLRAFLGRRLPEHMVPPVFVAMESLPLTPNGKVDRKALPAPDRGHTGPADPTDPTDPITELLAGIWSDVLELDRVGRHDDFFALGGHSLLAAQVASRIRQVLGVETPLRDLFEFTTIAELAEVIRAARLEGQAPPPPPITPVPRGGGLPVSFAQQRLWLIAQLEPGSPAYNIPSAVRLSGEVPVPVLARVFAEVVRRHEALRTTFAARAGRPVQMIAPISSPELPVIDLSRLPVAAREAQARRLAAAEAWRPFDLQSGPLLRLALLRLSEREHILLTTLHHIVSDGWSQGVLLREIAALYAAFAQGRASPLPELPVQYADFAVWQHGWLAGEVLEGQLAYWKRQLAGAPQVLELPADRPRPAMQTFRGAAQTVILGPALSASVRELCRRAGVTPFMALLAAWAVLLGRHAGQQDLLLGTPIAGRTRREIEDLIGFFVNTLVLRADLSGAPAFGTFLERIREAALGAFSHQEMPFERLVEELAAERDLSRSPLFQVLFVLQNVPLSGVSVPGLVFSPVALESRVAKFDLSLTLFEGAEGFAGSLERNTDLFDASTSARLLARFTALLEAAAGDPGRSVAELPVLLPAERQQALLEWNDTARVFPAGVCLHELVAAQAARTPDAVAAVEEEEVLTYRDLERRAGRLARHLIDLGAGPDGRVGVLMERSLEMIVGLLGVLKAGAAYVPLDPSHPAERLAFLMADAGTSVVLTQARLAHLLPGRGERTVLLDVHEDLPDTAPAAGVVQEDHLAYVMYTSGSTGAPKGVMIPHRGIVNRLLWMQETLGLTPEDRVLQKTPFSFDVSLWELFSPLLAGARLVFARPEGHRDPAYLAELIARQGITVAHFVPPMLQAFLETPGVSALPSLRRVLTSGEALAPELVRRFFARLGRRGGGVELVNLYGPTEASVEVSFWPCEPEPARGIVPIGRPIANLRLHVVDGALRPQPIGVPGELLLGGVGLARGYLGRPELTASSFVPDPLGAAAGARLYRTGDRARLLPDGTVESLGRLDGQVKIRGVRIELGEIETVLASHPAVRECAVVAREDTPDVPLLVAYVAAREEIEAADLRAFLARRLPDAMVPAVFIGMAALPLNANGKVDRKALPAPGRARRGHGEPAIPPGTRTEELVAEIWKDLLGLDEISVEDGFFALGGHSLLASQAVARIRQTFAVDLPLREIFRHPTVAGIAGLIDARTAPPPEEKGLAAFLGEIDALSDEEARSRLVDRLSAPEEA